jgi:pimeloyl-ACP methyl ester carboxylesterase
VPTLVVVGEEDELSPPSEADDIVSAVPGAQLVRIPASGHLTAVETPDEFNDALLAFLATI